MKSYRILSVILICVLLLLTAQTAFAESCGATVTVEQMIVRSGSTTSSKKLGVLKQGTKVTVLSVMDNVAKIEYKGKTGYALVSAMELDDNIYVVTAKSAKVYTKADTKSKAIATVKKGFQVNVKAIGNGWAKVSHGTRIGYMQLKVLEKYEEPAPTPTPAKEDAPVTMYAVENGVKVFKSASTGAKVIATLKKGTAVQVTAQKGSWSRVKNGSSTGYIQTSRLTAVKPGSKTLEPTMSKTASVTKAMGVYKNMSTANRTGSLKKGDKVTVLAVSGSWALIEKSGKRGYTGKSGLKVASDPVSPEVIFTATVIRDDTTVYADADSGSKKIGTLHLGGTVDVVDYSDNWVKILAKGKTYYVKRNTLTKSKYSTLSKGSSGDSVKKLQTALEELGYMDSAPDGDYGTNTVTAVKRLETALGLMADGEADELVQQVLYGNAAPESSILNVTLKKGSVNSDVTRLQTRLTAKKFFAAEIDGDFGSITEKAVKLYQKTVGLSQTGTADPITLQSLFSGDAPKYTGTPVTDAVENIPSSTGKWTEDYSRSDPAAGTASATIEKVISIAISKLGCKYVYATSNGTTFDCSGFVSYCYGKVGLSLAHSAYSIGYGKGTKISSISDLQRGDVISFNTNESDSDLSDHVGIYLGNYQFIHASSSAGKVVISQLKDGFYKRVFSWARRMY